MSELLYHILEAVIVAVEKQPLLYLLFDRKHGFAEITSRLILFMARNTQNIEIFLIVLTKG